MPENLEIQKISNFRTEVVGINIVEIDRRIDYHEVGGQPCFDAGFNWQETCKSLSYDQFI